MWWHGALWFERHLVDYDAHSNTGQWLRSAGVWGVTGSKKRRLNNNRYLRIALDGSGNEAVRYVRRWLPMLADVPDHWLLWPWMAPLIEQQTWAGFQAGDGRRNAIVMDESRYPVSCPSYAASSRGFFEAELAKRESKKKGRQQVGSGTAAKGRKKKSSK